ncbi:DUF4190 domain-containing protein [Streptomyces sp. ISL-98]|nr:DUF4190 domain-containing protein [Streptomyces sp. ISL-98]
MSDADARAVAAFTLGTLGLLAGNIFLGPAAIVLSITAFKHRTSRPGLATTAILLGLADLAVLAILIVRDGTVSWAF